MATNKIIVGASLALCTLVLSQCTSTSNQRNVMKTNRKSTYPVDDLIIDRWSPRAMSGQEISNQELMSLFEAARWAPSSYNNQPWRFIYAHRNTDSWSKLFNLFVPFNQSWTKDAAALVLVISSKNFAHNGQPSRTHSFDTGAAVENLALQATSMGLVCHAMEGFDYDKARTTFNIPEDYNIEAMLAIGRPAPASRLPQELQEREVPSDRKPLDSFVFNGTFKQ